MTENEIITNSYSITDVIQVYDIRTFPDIRITCNGTINNWIVGLPSSLSSPRHVHLQLRRSNGLITALDMNTSNAELISTNVYNFTMNNETAVEVQNGDKLVIIPTPANPIYCLENNGPPNYRINNDPLDNNHYPLISVIISKCPLMLCYIYTFIEPTTTSDTDTITPTDIPSSNNNPPMTPTTHTTAILTFDSNIKKSTTLTPTVHDNTAYTQNTISEYII